MASESAADVPTSISTKEEIATPLSVLASLPTQGKTPTSSMNGTENGDPSTQGEGSQTPNSAEEDEPSWKCTGEYFHYPVPSKQGDPYANLLQPIQETDKKQCEDWKAEIETLLIFAGLFSAVVTAFVVESYKGLQPDPQDTVIALLSRIATSLEGPQLNSTLPAAAASLVIGASQATPAIIRVNALWFVSLVFSLTTVLAGTVSLQWIRNHQHHSTDSDHPFEKLSVTIVRQQGIKTWYMPQIISLLPVILQVALVLFLVGLIDFLILVAPPKVFTPTITVIGLPILFLLITTIAPSFQWILAPSVYAQLFPQSPVPCPYRSPQSDAAIFILKSALMLLLDSILALQQCYSYRKDRPKLTFLASATSHSTPSDALVTRYLTTLGFEAYRNKLLAWRVTSSAIVTTEDSMFPPQIYQNIHKVGYGTNQISNIKILCAGANHKYEMYYLFFSCLVDIVNKFGPPTMGLPRWKHYYIRNLLKDDWPNCEIQVPSDIFDTRHRSMEEGSVFYAETLLLICRFLCLSKHRWSLEPPISLNTLLHELLIRTTSHYVGKSLPKPSSAQNQDKAIDYLSKDQVFPLRSFPTSDAMTARLNVFPRQYTKSIALLFTVGAIPESTENRVGHQVIDDILSYPHITEFVKIACDNQLLDGKVSTLDVIATQIDKYMSSDHQHIEPQYLLFYFMACYVGLLSEEKDDDTGKPVLFSALPGLALKLGKFQNKVGLDVEHLIKQEKKKKLAHTGYKDFIIYYKGLPEQQAQETSAASRLSHNPAIFTIQEDPPANESAGGQLLVRHSGERQRNSPTHSDSGPEDDVDSAENELGEEEDSGRESTDSSSGRESDNGDDDFEDEEIGSGEHPARSVPEQINRV